tara:strand:+ start:822 stop:1865 length:1044 start_codon:yes stop_codon:yes gene_type:complete
MKKESLQEIIDAGNLAPSGGNSQSWKFYVRGSEIDVIPLVEKDHKILNIGGRGTYIGCGAVLENMEQKAKELGFSTSFVFFPKDGIAATASFSEGFEGEHFASEISNRHSNRKPYKKDSLTEEEKEFLFKEVSEFENLNTSLVEGEEKGEAAKCLAHDIVLNMKNKDLHDLLFDEVLWKEEEQKEKAGLYVKTMEAVPPKSFIFKLLGNWNVAKFFTKIGLIDKIYEESSQNAASSSAIVAIIAPNNHQDFVRVGKLLQNIWLRATKLGFSMQIHAGIIFLSQQVLYGKVDVFTDEEEIKLKELNSELHTLFSVPKDKALGIIFRIGKAEEPLATSYKRRAVVEWSN